MPSAPPKLEVAREEARWTLSQQSSTFDDIETKAIQVMRFDVALTTLVVSALAVAERTAVLSSGSAPGVGALVNAYSAAGIASILASTLLAGVTYTVSVRYCGPAPSAVEAALEDVDDDEFRRRLVAGYADWIRQNHRLNRRVAALSTAAILAVVFGAVALVFGAMTALGHPPSLAVVALTAVVFLVAVYVSGLGRQLYRLATDREDLDASGDGSTPAVDALAGQAVFRGREEGDSR